MSPRNDGCTAAVIIQFLKTKARQLQRAAESGDDKAMQRLRSNCPAVALGADVQRKHALATLAREIGFENWKKANDCFESRKGATWGEFLYPKRCHVHWNIWFASYKEAKVTHANHDGFLLPYKHQFMIVDADYIRSLGLDPADACWTELGRDWITSGALLSRDNLALSLAEVHIANVEGLTSG